MIKAVKHVSIPVKDQDKSLKFYKDILGFEVICDAPATETQRWIALKIPDGQTNVVLFTPDGHQDRIGTFSNIIFTCEDVRQTFNDLQKKGVVFIQEPKEEPWGTYALFQDVDGNTFCLSSPPPVLN
jgi:predicted enzyme related to lactoylglutathione lyase